jgi:hypothetical protein
MMHDGYRPLPYVCLSLIFEIHGEEDESCTKRIYIRKHWRMMHQRTIG